MNRIPVHLLLFALVAAAFLLPCAAPGQETETETTEKFEAAAAKLDAELEAALAELTAIRDRIAEEKPPLAAKMQETAMILREKQREYDIARSSREAITSEFEKAERELQLWRDERSYLDGLLFDFRKNYEAASSLARTGALSELLLAADKQDDSGTKARLDLVADGVDNRLQRADRRQCAVQLPPSVV